MTPARRGAAKAGRKVAKRAAKPQTARKAAGRRGPATPPSARSRASPPSTSSPRGAAAARSPPHAHAGRPPSPATLVARLAREGRRIAVAESCTGGLLGARITDVPGASAVFDGGVIAYDDRVKTGLLGFPTQLLQASGAVSASAAEAMAHGVRDLLGSDLAVAVSGIAGPGGARDGKPVGTVWIAVVGPGDLVHVHRIQADGDRAQVRRAAVQEALRLVARALDEAGPAGPVQDGFDLPALSRVA